MVVDEELQQLRLGLGRAATKKEAHLLAKELQAHEARIDECSSKAAVAEVG